MLQESAAIHDLNVNPKTWTVAQLNIFLQPLKTKDTSSIPTRKADIYDRLLQWKDRLPRMMELDGIEIAAEEEAAPQMEVHNHPENTNEEDETITVTMMLNIYTSAADQLPVYIEYI